MNFCTCAISSAGKISGSGAGDQNKLGAELTLNTDDFPIRANSDRLRLLQGDSLLESAEGTETLRNIAPLANGGVTLKK